jgi:lipoprotein-anchoring transpeptidase ErfK/SrfK
VRTIAVSSGKPSTPTPPGDYRVYAKLPRWWSVPFREWLPYALPFVGGIAFHEFADVPAYPASHGCVRQSSTVASWTYGFAYVGMPVKVIANSRPAQVPIRSSNAVTRSMRKSLRDAAPLDRVV